MCVSVLCLTRNIAGQYSLCEDLITNELCHINVMTRIEKSNGEWTVRERDVNEHTMEEDTGRLLLPLIAGVGSCRSCRSSSM